MSGSAPTDRPDLGGFEATIGLYTAMDKVEREVR
jgi:hypothetical protein